jgi:arylsulfatase
MWSVKWMYYKMVLRYNSGPGPEAVNHGPEEPTIPMFFDLSSDPHEDYNLWNATLTMGWVYGAMSEIVYRFDRA